MADRLKGKIIYVDQFNADVTLSTGSNPFVIRKIRMLSATDGDIFRLEDVDGNRLLHMVNTGAADVVEVDFGEEGFNFGGNGVIIDYSDCTGMDATNGTDAVWIYLA